VARSSGALKLNHHPDPYVRPSRTSVRLIFAMVPPKRNDRDELGVLDRGGRRSPSTRKLIGRRPVDSQQAVAIDQGCAG
jgi:hypothetical protein